MPNLKCHKYDCKYNQCTHCSKDLLSISSDAYCNDYIRQEIGDFDNSFEYAYEGPLSLKKDEHQVNCNDIDCLNNNCKSCTASYIRIDRHNNGAKCCQVRENK